jgi:hypothetical protein
MDNNQLSKAKKRRGDNKKKEEVVQQPSLQSHTTDPYSHTNPYSRWYSLSLQAVSYWFLCRSVSEVILINCAVAGLADYGGFLVIFE